MVFQNYALFPHMTVAENLAYPLTVRSWRRADIAARVAEFLDLIELGGYGDRHPGQLSGGQRQRVALARALIFDPTLVLMDEPLGALDRKLREQMQLEITRLHRKLGFTVIYVTHDQAEAGVAPPSAAGWGSFWIGSGSAAPATASRASFTAVGASAGRSPAR